MSTGEVVKRTGPKAEVSHEVPKHDRPFTGPKKSPRVVRDPRAVLRGEYEQVTADLQKWNVSETLIQMEAASNHQLQLYLLAEEAGRARPEVLRSFPKPGQMFRQRLASALAPQKTPRSRKRPVAQEV